MNDAHRDSSASQSFSSADSPAKCSATSSSIPKAGLFYLVFVMFSYCTGGPVGIEDMVTNAGPGMTLLYLVVLPFFWCIPVSLVSAELTAAMPVEGGFYRWTRAAFGDFWGFLAGWWNWTASFLLGGAYAVLFTDYLVYYFPQLTGLKHYLVCLALIAAITWINVRGIQMVGRFATALEIFIFIPVVVMVAIGLSHWRHNPVVPFIPPHQRPFAIFGIGLALGLWSYSGYEQLSTVAGEVDNPQRNYPRALAWVVPLSIATYCLPILAGLAAIGDWQNWHTGYLADSAGKVGNLLFHGSWLGTWMTLSAMVANVALLNSTVLTTTRMPFAMAEDGYLSHSLTRRHERYGTPWLAIVVSAVIYGLLAWQSLGQLISVYIWLRSATTVMTVLSAWKLRRTRPDLPRTFVIPGGKVGLICVVAAPVVMALLALLGSDRFATIGGAIAMALGPAVYWFLKRFRARTQP